MSDSVYQAANNRYTCGMDYRRAGKSGILLPAISLGLWHNFGDVDSLARSKDKLHYAFDHGITHFDLANNYGPSAGSAEETFGKIMKTSFAPYRDELFVSTKAGHDMWPGPYGTWGSRKHLTASLNQSLKRMNLDYVRQGKALYVGISKYPPEAARKAYAYLKDHDVICLLYQGRYNLLNREPEEQGILQQAAENGSGFVAFSPLAQGLLTNRYLKGIPEDSRIARGGFLKKEALTEDLLQKIIRLDRLACERGQSLAEMSLAWLLAHPLVTSVIVGASSVEQLADNLKALENISFSQEEQQTIQAILQ